MEFERMPCGGVPHPDYGAGYGYRCDLCNAVIGSVGQSDKCKEANKNYLLKAKKAEPKAEQTSGVQRWLKN